MRPIRPRWASFDRFRASSGLPRSCGTVHPLPRITPKCTSHVLSTRSSSTAPSPENAFKARLQEIKNSCPEPYPRLATDARTLSCAEFRARYSRLDNNETVDEDTVVINAITGKPHRTGRGELTVDATELPRLLSPCLHDVPLDAKEHEVSPYARHVQFLADPSTANLIKARASIIQYLRQFFLDRAFMEVSTPIIASIAGGAIARPFYTSATEFPDRQLSLRIAPELWLKRLVVGGFDKVFEIGPSFRNEGVDKTHNPEFTTCEFYHTYFNLEDLMSITESLLSGMAEHIRTFNENGTLKPTEVSFSTPFRRIDFIPAIEEKIGHRLPELTADDALVQVKQLFADLSLPLPINPTLPRLLDELCATYIEPQCIDPTFIINPPECLSPLSKTFTHPTTGQRVAARGELFIEGKEVVNTYEEENSPFEQRRKLEDQVRFSKSADESAEVDESYIEALEWGLPSTGGWGCGIDRLCMLFTGAKNIGDVLPFGNIRTVTRPYTGRSGSAPQQE
ncbi:hypothetical protein ASPZODRAFT_24683 [Penicilliopsis zonata CBS 506.65]|uniref:Aminoacyl-transfer RNA synthetases class-II family profile domain-containing protein n=1 Tax=Penicilliopsis zonata CBS 506.65 TaxID=1073090 RepID=A0A1L9SKZ8_9EURO|nr:hypothetical protein ASPZODRAFT_24683 [Penicilliopsis zonata CBS 506.65]OJJ47793.1 hypothetical protein ASPZODRAFT_24683 [Penicilliopsis zonata CBS 506.65]